MDWLSPHVSLELENLGQGKVIEHLREAIVKAQQDIVTFLRKHGDASKGANATVSLKLTFKIDNPAEAHVKITHKLSAVPPTLPAGETSGFVENDGKGTKLMVVRGNTPTADISRQLSLFAGSVQFDPATGEIQGGDAAVAAPINQIDVGPDLGLDPVKLEANKPLDHDPMGA